MRHRSIRMHALCWLTLVGLTLAGCEDEGKPFVPEPDPIENVSFSTQIQPFFTQTCATSGCHVGMTAPGGMDLSTGNAYDATVDVLSPNYLQTRILPTAPESSLLYLKVTGDAPGAQMPIGGSTTEVERETLRVWIEEGALRN